MPNSAVSLDESLKGWSAASVGTGPLSWGVVEGHTSPLLGEEEAANPNTQTSAGSTGAVTEKRRLTRFDTVRAPPPPLAPPLRLGPHTPAVPQERLHQGQSAPPAAQPRTRPRPAMPAPAAQRAPKPPPAPAAARQEPRMLTFGVPQLDGERPSHRLSPGPQKRTS